MEKIAITILEMMIVVGEGRVMIRRPWIGQGELKTGVRFGH